LAVRKIKDTKNAPEATADCAQQLQRLMPKNFAVATPWPQLQHFARYLKAVVLRRRDGKNRSSMVGVLADECTEEAWERRAAAQRFRMPAVGGRHEENPPG
jgi:hypothetical protein